MLNPDQRLREHLEDALAEADALGQTVVAATFDYRIAGFLG